MRSLTAARRGCAHTEAAIPAASTMEAVLRHVRDDLGQPLQQVLELCERWLWQELDEAAALSCPIDEINGAAQQMLRAVNRFGRSRDRDGNVATVLRRLGRELRAALAPQLVRVKEGVALCRELCIALPDSEAVDVNRALDQIEAEVASLESRLHARFDVDGLLGGSTAAAARLQTPTRGGDASLDGHVLLVDDQPVVQAVVGGTLRALGCRVTAVGSGEEALEALEAGDVDTILLDLLLPGMSGQEVLAAVSSDRELRDIPVIVLTGVSDPEEVARCIDLGATDVLDKQHHPSVLRARVQNCIERKRAREREVAWYWEAVAEKKRSDALLRAILPSRVVAELKETGSTRARQHDFVAVLFCDISGFTKYCTEHDADTIRDALQELTEIYEQLCSAFRLEKIKTIGDSFMAVAGLHDGTEHPCELAVRCGLEMLAVAPTLTAGWHVRVAIHAGPVIAGVVGRQKYQYDIWGDTVNTAARIEGLARVDELWVSDAVRDCLGPGWPLQTISTFEVRGKGAMVLHRVEGKPVAVAEERAAPADLGI